MSLALPMGSSLRKWSLCVQMAWRWTLRSEHRVPVCSGHHRKLKFVRSCNSYHSHDSWSAGPRGARVNPFGEGIDGSECGTGILPQYRSYQFRGFYRVGVTGVWSHSLILSGCVRQDRCPGKQRVPMVSGAIGSSKERYSLWGVSEWDLVSESLVERGCRGYVGPL